MADLAVGGSLSCRPVNPEDPKGRRDEFVGISESEEYEIWSVLSL